MAHAGRRVDELAAAAGGTVVGDPGAVVARVAAVDEADDQALTFAVDERWLVKALASPARAIIVPKAAHEIIVPKAEQLDQSKTFIVVDDVRRALALILQKFSPPLPQGEFTHPNAVVASDVSRAHDVWIGAGVVVCEGAILQHGVVLLPGSYVGRNRLIALIGAGSVLHPHAVVADDCILGKECVLQAGCIIGSDGFGFVRVGAEQMKIPQIGNVILGDRVEVGAFTTIDRGVT